MTAAVIALLGVLGGILAAVPVGLMYQAINHR